MAFFPKEEDVESRINTSLCSEDVHGLIPTLATLRLMSRINSLSASSCREKMGSKQVCAVKADKIKYSTYRGSPTRNVYELRDNPQIVTHHTSRVLVLFYLNPISAMLHYYLCVRAFNLSLIIHELIHVSYYTF